VSRPVTLGLTRDLPAERPPRARGSARATAVLSFGLVANLATLMTFAATLHEIALDWSLDATQSGWIGSIYFAGYAVAVPFLASATDRMDGRWLYVGSALVGATASIAFAVLAHSFGVALVLRFLGGIGLAGVHMPGLNLLMDRIDRSYQGRAAGIYTSSYAAGSAGSFLIAGLVDAAFGWRATFVAAGVGPILSICALPLLPAGRLSENPVNRGRPTEHSSATAPSSPMSQPSPEIPGRSLRCACGSSRTSAGP
jgi:MFS family permease